jgi:hypothetical protein
MSTQIKAHSIWRNRKTQGFYQVMVPDAIDCTNGRSLPVTAMVVYREAGNLVPLSGDQVFVRVRDEFLEKFEPCPPCIEFGRVGQGVLMTKLPMLTQQFSAADRTLLTQALRDAKKALEHPDVKPILSDLKQEDLLNG